MYDLSSIEEEVKDVIKKQAIRVSYIKKGKRINHDKLCRVVRNKWNRVKKELSYLLFT